MKYSLSVDIDIPRKRLVSIFTDMEHAAEWQEGLQRREHLEGDKNSEGSRSRMKFRIGKEDLEMEEIILKSDLPDSITYEYRVRGVTNICENQFQELDESRTRWTQINEFRMQGFMKLMAFFAPGAFRKQTEADMKRFKEYAETLDGES